MLIWKNLDTHNKKIVQSVHSGSQCGFEAFRLLSKELDPVGDDLASTLLERVTAVASWQIKGPAEEFAALREVDNRLTEMERRLDRVPGRPDEHKLQQAIKTNT